MAKGTLRERIKKATLTAGENQTINKLIDNMDRTVFLSGQQMAAFCDVSATSMTRLIQKLGYQKFGAFKEDFEEMYRETITPYDMFEDFLESDSKDALVQESKKNYYSNLISMENMLDEQTTCSVAECIRKARKIYVVGMFSSEIVVRALGHFLWRIGKEYKEVTGLGLYHKFAYSDMQKGDVLIAISSQRIVREVLQCVEYAKKEQMMTVAITDNFTNPLARAADYVLAAPVKGVMFDCTHVASLSVVNALMNCVASGMAGEVEQHLKYEAEKAVYKDLFIV